MAQTKQETLLFTRKSEFFEAFKVMYGIFRRDLAYKNEPELFRATVDIYYRRSFSLPTEKIKDFMGRFTEEFPSPAQWDAALANYLPQKEEELPPPTKKDQAFGNAICRAIFIPHRAAKYGGDENYDIHVGRALLMKSLHENFKKQLPGHWRKILDSASPVILETTDKITKKYIESEKNKKVEFKRL